MGEPFFVVRASSFLCFSSVEVFQPTDRHFSSIRFVRSFSVGWLPPPPPRVLLVKNWRIFLVIQRVIFFYALLLLLLRLLLFRRRRRRRARREMVYEKHSCVGARFFNEDKLYLKIYILISILLL